ncbi:MAG: hypothetical protein KJO07_06605 [Deltaproteobacteria bacterium]|nr:hypothetical protein [Deltaproteobacteria bacterium]
MKRLARWLLLGCAVCSVACEPGLTVPIDAALAVGTSKRFTITDDCNRSSCDNAAIVEIVEVVVDEPSIVGASDFGTDSILLTAYSEGSTRITVVAADNERELRMEEVDVETFEIEDFQLRPVTCRHSDSGFVDLLPPEAEVTYTWSFSGPDGEPLEGDAVLDGGGLVEISYEPESSRITYQTPPGQAAYQITSPASPDPLRTVQTYVDADIDAMQVDVSPTNVSVASSSRVTIIPTIATVAPCLEELERSIVVTTPTICSLDSELEVAEASTTDVDFRIYGREAGTCQFEVTFAANLVSQTAAVQFE